MAVAGRLSGPESQRYADPATELEVIRLTEAAWQSSDKGGAPVHVKY